MISAVRLRPTKGLDPWFKGADKDQRSFVRSIDD